MIKLSNDVKGWAGFGHGENLLKKAALCFECFFWKKLVSLTISSQISLPGSSGWPDPPEIVFMSFILLIGERILGSNEVFSFGN